MNPNQDLIERRRPLVIALAGGGSEVVGDLLRHGGMSDTLLAAHVFQATAVTDAYIGVRPDRYASPEAARALAVAAYQECRGLRPGGENHVGVGVTSSLVKPLGEREGREHSLHIAYQRRDETTVTSVVFRAERTREQEERLAADLVFKAVRWAFNWMTRLDDTLAPEDTISVNSADGGCWSEVFHGEESVYPTHASGEAPPFLLPSSCNPFHDGHLFMADYVRATSGLGVGVELCVRNADKPPLDYLAVRDRLRQTRKKSGLPVFLTNAGTFREKAEVFPGATFLVGSDTILRVNEVRFAGGSRTDLLEQFRVIRDRGCSFWVFPRPGTPAGPRHLENDLAALCTFVDATTPDLSSTQIRKESARA